MSQWIQSLVLYYHAVGGDDPVGEFQQFISRPLAQSGFKPPATQSCASLLSQEKPLGGGMERGTFWTG